VVDHLTLLYTYDILKENLKTQKDMERTITPDFGPVESALFKMCICGGSHGYICFGEKHTGMIGSKKQATVCLEELKSSGLITLEESRKIEEEIKKSSLHE